MHFACDNGPVQACLSIPIVLEDAGALAHTNGTVQLTSHPGCPARRDRCCVGPSATVRSPVLPFSAIHVFNI